MTLTRLRTTAVNHGLLALAAAALFIGGCTWVEPMEGADEVALVKTAHVQQCERLGRTTASVRDRVGFIDRKDEKVEQELLSLAKNTAISMGGDTLVQSSEIVDGRQEFIVYNCGS